MDDLTANTKAVNLDSSAAPAAQNTATSEEWPLETCRYWALDNNCNNAKYQRAHYLFPIITNRAHRYPINIEPCKAWLASECSWPADACGFAHERSNDSTDKDRQNIARLVNNQDWTSKLTLKCKHCRDYEIVCREEDYDSAKAIAKHCDGCRPTSQLSKKLVETSTMNLLKLPSSTVRLIEEAAQTTPAQVRRPPQGLSMADRASTQPEFARMGSDTRGRNFPKGSLQTAPYVYSGPQASDPRSNLNFGFPSAREPVSDTQEAERRRKNSKERKMSEDSWWRRNGDSQRQ